MRTSACLRETVSGSSTEFSLRRIGETIYQAFLHGSVKLVVLVGSLLQLPFLVLQFVLKLLCYLFLPIALALFMIPSQAQLATRYVQQTLASWPGLSASRSPNWSPITCSRPTPTISPSLRSGPGAD